MNLSTPYFLIDEKKIRENCEILHDVEVRSGAKILLAQKAYSVYQTYPVIAKYLSGTTSSGLYEAKLAAEEFGKEIHVFEPAYGKEEFAEILSIADHVYFNSLTQFEVHKDTVRNARASIALRLNPECSTQDGHDIYDPCAPGSRLGIRETTLRKWGEEYHALLPEVVSGLHMHTLCEQGFDDLLTTWKAFELHFRDYLLLPQITWLNLGGGHHITRGDYDVDGLVKLLTEIRETYHVQVYLEPGEAVVLDAGQMVTEVMDIVETEQYPVLILDTSAACHMPDIIEMPYLPPMVEGVALEKADANLTGTPYIYRLSSRTCLSGDVIGDYVFDHEIQVGEQLHFLDMALYTMVKTNTFNGMPLPAIAVLHENGQKELIRSFSYDDFKMRL